MPTVLPAATEAAARRALAKFSGAMSQDVLRQATEKLIEGLKSILAPGQEERIAADGTITTATVGETRASLESKVSALVDRFAPEKISGELNLDFKIQTATKVANGAGRFVAQQADVDEYPALELYRLYDRDVPRGFKMDKGALVEVPDDDWPSRWTAAAQESGDDDALRLLNDTGRMIALKASPIWQALGDGAGGHDDTLGNPFPPFAFNSGYDVDGVPRAECEELGLLAPGDAVTGAEIDPEKLFAFKEAA